MQLDAEPAADMASVALRLLSVDTDESAATVFVTRCCQEALRKHRIVCCLLMSPSKLVLRASSLWLCCLVQTVQMLNGLSKEDTRALTSSWVFERCCCDSVDAVGGGRAGPRVPAWMRVPLRMDAPQGILLNILEIPEGSMIQLHSK